MKKITIIMSLFAMVFMYASTVPAQDQDRDAGIGWRAQYRVMLEEGKKTMSSETLTKDTGLPYTPSEEVSLREAVTFALSREKGNRACECLQMAVELDYNPYSVLKAIYGIGGDLEIDELCSCATETGMTKAIIAQAATDAVDSGEKPIYDVDEITRSQCLTGLAYQLSAVKTREEPDPPVSPILP